MNAKAQAQDGCRSRVAAIVAVVVAFLASMVGVSVLVVRSSIAAFTDTTASSGNTLSTGTVDLVDDDLDTALFSVAGLIPGRSVTDCIEVTYSEQGESVTAMTITWEVQS